MIDKLRALLGEVLEMEIPPSADVQRASTAAWDSLNHLRVVMAVEEEFGVRLEPDQVASIGSLSDLERLISSQTQAA
jgi:acyl carrier protein